MISAYISLHLAQWSYIFRRELFLIKSVYSQKTIRLVGLDSLVGLEGQHQLNVEIIQASIGLAALNFYNV